MLKALFSGQSISDKKSLQSLAKKGMLVEKNNDYLFSSPVMARYALQKLVGIPAKRTEGEPESLKELIIFVLSSLAYHHFRSSLGKTKQTGILLEKALQMEFYKTAIKCTPHGWYVSADVGALFGSTGAIDFTIYSQDMKIFWGIEHLTESDRINEHIGRFGMEGRYNHLCARFTDHCLVDFRMVQTTEDARGNLNRDNRVFTLCYDISFSRFRYFSSKYPTGLKLNPEPENR